MRRDAAFLAYASDNDPESVRLTQENAVKAGVASRIKVKRADLSDFRPLDTERPGIVLTNPPYGERLLDLQEAEQICRTMGEVFVPGDRTGYYIISPHDSFEELFGRPAARRRKLYNGSIRCQLFMYFQKPDKHPHKPTESNH